MKYLAILRDSFREARDSKVLLVLICLSAIVILIVASLTFTPATPQKTFERFVDGKINIVLNIHDPVKLEESTRRIFLMKLVNVEQIDGSRDSPHGEYVLTVLCRDTNQVNEEQARKAKEEVIALFQQAQDLDLIRVRKIEVVPSEDAVAAPRGTLLRVTVQGTSRTLRLWENDMSIVFGAIPLPDFAQMLGFQISMLADIVISLGSWGAVLLGVVITSFFIPNMLRKGTVDMLLSKPIHRWSLLVNKYIGGLSFIFLLNSFAIGGIWLAIGFRTGLWPLETLLLIPSITFFFAILYAVSTLVGVMTRSTIACILVTFAAWLLFFAVGTADGVFRTQRKKDEAKSVPMEKRWAEGGWAQVVTVLHFVTPRTSDLNRLNGLIVYCGYVTGSLDDIARFNAGETVWWESLLVSGAWIVFFVGVSCMWFSTRDY
jgi:ABC-type transport system involved in multi-copper enzyme maturation permease subunit